jgi:hypothetical protein
MLPSRHCDRNDISGTIATQHVRALVQRGDIGSLTGGSAQQVDNARMKKLKNILKCGTSVSGVQTHPVQTRTVSVRPCRRRAVRARPTSSRR